MVFYGVESNGAQELLIKDELDKLLHPLYDCNWSASTMKDGPGSFEQQHKIPDPEFLILTYTESLFQQISERHAILEWVNDSWTIRDLGSSNGTQVNGKDVQPAMEGAGMLLPFGTISWSYPAPFLNHSRALDST